MPLPFELTQKLYFRSNILSVVYKLCDGLENPLLSFPFGSKILHISPITKYSLLREDHIRLLSEWRKEHMQWFPTQFAVSYERTRKWLKEQVLDKTDRILFFIHFDGEEPFAHVGFDRLEMESRSWSIDNVVRGRTPKGSKGAMSVALQAMIEWAYKEIGIERLSLLVFDDNERAKKLYYGLGFRSIQKVPLREKIENGVTFWEDTEEMTDIWRYQLLLIHDGSMKVKT